MLTFIKGTSGTKRTDYILKIILDIVGKQEKILVIVPEQFSFETQKFFLRIMGPKLFNRINVTSFSYLARDVMKKNGDSTKIRLNGSGRLIFMNLVIKNLKEELLMFNATKNISDLAELLIDTLEKLKIQGIKTNELSQLALFADSPELKLKLEALEKVSKNYESMISASYSDPSNDLTLLANILSQKNLFKGYTVFFDSFTGFTYDEFQVIKQLSNQAADMYFSLCCDDLKKYNEYELFATVKKTEISLKKQIDMECKEIYLNEHKRFENEELKFLEANVFREENRKYQSESEKIKIYAAEDMYDESEFVARKIKQLVIEEGYRYRDFAVIGRDISAYKGILDNTFEKYDIPYFWDTVEDISAKPLMTLVRVIFEIINSSFQKNDIFCYLKTGLNGYTAEEISMLENYALLWNINHKDWFNEFEQNPRGFVEEFRDSDKKILQKINMMRKNIITPIYEFSQKIKDTTGEKITEELYNLLVEINVPKMLEKYSKELYENNEFKLAEEQPRLWDILMGMLDQLAVALNGIKINVRQYADILKSVFEHEHIAFVPKSTDDVSIGSADRMRPANPKVSFVVGAVDGMFPLLENKSGMFSHGEFEQLSNIGIELNDNISMFSSNERLLAYFALTSASQKLFVSYHNFGNRGEEKTASIIIKELQAVFPSISIKCKSDLDYSELLWSKASAFQLLCSIKDKNPIIANTIIKSLENDSKYAPKLLKLFNSLSTFDFKDENNSKMLFGENITVSASQIEKYYLCPFRYLCSYGFAAKEIKPASLDAIEYGSLVHYLLEKIFKKHSVKFINNMQAAELREEVTYILNSYVKLKFGGYKNKAARFKFLLTKCIGTSCRLIKYIAKELSESGFVPCDFELAIGSDAKALSLQLPDGDKVNIKGFIDRVDIIEKNDINFLRIVDYKTGIKEFRLSDILYGLNMQMLVYLDALLKSGRYPNSRAAGILYMPANLTAVTASRNIEKSIAEKLNREKLKMNGLIANEEAVLESMGNSVKKSNILNDEDLEKRGEGMQKILNKIESLVIDMVKNLKEGNVRPLPAKGEYDACAFCEYSFICSYEDGDNCREIVKISNKAVLDKIAKRENDE